MARSNLQWIIPEITGVIYLRKVSEAILNVFRSLVIKISSVSTCAYLHISVLQGIRPQSLSNLALLIKMNGHPEFTDVLTVVANY